MKIKTRRRGREKKTLLNVSVSTQLFHILENVALVRKQGTFVR
jgi:hypothetical protein